MSEDSRMDDDETDKDDDVVVAPVEVAEAIAPVDTQTEPVVDSTVEPEAEAASAEPVVEKPVLSFTDTLLKEVADSDPMKAALIEKAIEKEATRRKDEWAGREAGWLEKADRKNYANNPKQWLEDKRKIAEYDKLRSEVEASRKAPKPETPAKVAETPVVDSVLDDAKKFVTENNIDEAQTPLIAALFEKIAARTKSAKDTPVIDVRKELALIQWEKEKMDAEADEDFKSNEVLQALAWKYSNEGRGPAKALSDAKTKLGIKPKIVVRTSGKPQIGRPAFAKPSGLETPTDGLKYDGKTDPFSQLKKKYSKED